MDSKIFDYKESISVNGERFLDLSNNSVIFPNETSILDIYVVTEETEMRMDLISEKYYGTSKYVDILCKINNIFNPLSIARDDILVIPQVLEDGNYVLPSTAEVNDIRSSYSKVATMSKKDQSRIERLKAKANKRKTGVSTPLPTNMLNESERSKVFEDGTILLGANLMNNN